MIKGKIIDFKYKNHHIVYKIKLDNNTIIESVEYSKFDEILKEDEEVNVEIIGKKAEILNRNITRVKGMTKKDYLTLGIILVIVLCICILKMCNMINHVTLIIIGAIIFIIWILDAINSTYLIVKKGITEEVEVIDKKEEYTANQPRSMRYNYSITVLLNDGTKLTNSIPKNKNTKKIKIGDKIKIRVYKNSFIVEDCI